jgi:hypothetical protein
MLVGERAQTNPVLGDIEEPRLTVPVKPLSALTVIVEVPAVPARTVTVAGLTATE